MLAQLIPGGVRFATMLLVEFDPESQWFAVAVTMVAKVIQNGGNVAISAMARSPEEIEDELSTLGVDIAKAYEEGHLSINDWYSATLSGGRIEPLNPGASVIDNSPKGSKMLSVKVQDLSVEFLKDGKLPKEASRIYAARWPAGTLNIVDSLSMFLRFNDEKAFAEYLETRIIAQQRKMQRVTLLGLVRGMHSEWLYKRLEATTDGVVDIRLMEEEGGTRNLYSR